MKEVTTLNVSAKNHFHYLKLLNGLLELTLTERFVLGSFLDIYAEAPTKNAFSTENKKDVAKKVGKKDFNTLNVYIKAFKDKGLIKKQDDRYIPIELLLISKKIEINISPK